MNSDQLEGKWKQVKGEVREKWGKLTDDDIHVVTGRPKQLIGKMQEPYGIAKEEATRQVDSFVKNLNDQPNFKEADDAIAIAAKLTPPVGAYPERRAGP